MKFKLSFADYKKIQRMSQKELSNWVKNLYEQGFKDGYVECSTSPKENFDIVSLEVAIRSTDGIGEKKANAIIENLKKLYFLEEV